MTTQTQEAPKLPNNIDTEVLKYSSEMSVFLTDIAKGWKLLTDTIANVNKENEDLKQEISDLKNITAEVAN
jgi:hypothetical protein